ncbi:MAG: hypothetical protein H7Y38_19265 [Armatimonadetes bacterium]|nr:hypothetical protein [Armatimonadota bacterium]
MNPIPQQNSWSQVPPTPRPVAPPPPTNPPPDRAKNNRVVAIILGSCGAFFLALVGLYFAAQNAPAKIVTPVRAPVPKQNGFDALKVAAEKLVRQKEVGDAAHSKPKKNWTIEQKRALVQANDAAINDAVASLRLPYLETNRVTSSSTAFPYYAKFRAVVRTLTLAGNVAWEEGNHRLAATRYMDAVTIGRRVPHNTALIGRLVGIACEYIGRAPVWKRLDTMDADTAAYCLTRLDAMQPGRLPFASTLAEEKWTLARMIEEIYNRPESFDESVGGADGDSKDDTTAVFRAYTKVVPKSVAVDKLNEQMDKIIAQSKKPFPQSKDELPESREILTRILIPVMYPARLKFVANETGDNLLRTALALRVYRLRNGKHPAALSDLVGAKLLPAVPSDPFALPGQSLKYKPLATGKYLLYSIGPDSVDDSGKGLATVKNGKTVRFIEAESKGDIVAGWYAY